MSKAYPLPSLRIPSSAPIVMKYSSEADITAESIAKFQVSTGAKSALRLHAVELYLGV